MANYLVASGSRKISQLEIATDPTPSTSASVLPMVIGENFPITNGTTVQITPNDFLNKLVWNASNVYSQSNYFRGDNEFSGSNTFSGSFSVNNTTASFTNTSGFAPVNTNIEGGIITLEDPLNLASYKLDITNGNGFRLQDSGNGGLVHNTVLQVRPSQGDIQINRETHFSNDVYITGSLRVQEIFYVFETASILNSSGSTQFGDTIDDEHVFSGSIILTGSLVAVGNTTLDGVNLSQFSASVQIESQSFASRVTQNEDDITLLSASFEFTSSQIFADIDYLSGSYENFSGSQYKFDSGSFSDDITENSQSLSLLSASFEATSSQIFDDIDYLSGSFEATSSQIFDDIDYLSGSFEATSSQIFDDIDYLSGSFESTSASLSTRVTQNEGDISILSASFETTSSKLINASGSFSTRVTQNEGDISILSASFETTSSKLINASGSFSTRVTDLESFSSSLDSTYATDAELASVSQSFETDIDTLSGSISSRFDGNETDISNLQTDSGSFSTRVTTNEGDISNLQTDSGSFSTRVTTNETNISQNTGDISILSASFETTSSKLVDGSGSFSTRVTDQESFSSSFDSNVLTYIDSVGVFSGSEQVNADTITNFDSNVLTYIDSLSVVSSSQQINADNVTNFDSNVLAYNNSLGLVSGSSQVVFNDVSLNPFVSTSAAISASNHLIPSDNEVYDLGTPTQRWRDLYLSGSTIDLGGLLIQRNVDGNVQFIDSASQATKSVTIDSITGSLDIDGSLTVNDITASGVASITRGSSGVVLNLDGTNAYDAETGIQLSVGRAKISGVLNSTGGTPGTTLRFYTMLNGGAVTENLRLESNGDLDVLNGNLVIGTAGKGIDFSAAAGGGAVSSLLDDYEEGTWTMGISFGGASTGVIYSSNTGTYTKIGNQVTVCGDLLLTNKGSSSGNATITGLPFAIASGNAFRAAGSILLAGVSFANQYASLVTENTTFIQLKETTEAGVPSDLTDGDFANTSQIIISLTYFTE